MSTRRSAARQATAEATISGWADTVARGGQVELRVGRGRLLALLLMSLAFVAVGLVLALAPGGVGNRVVGWTSVTFFGLCLVVFVRRLLAGGPQALVDSRGVALPSARTEIPWGSIQGAFAFEVRGNPIVQVVVDPGFARAWLATRRPLVRALGRASRAYLGGMEVMSLPSPLAADARLVAEWLDREAEQRNPAVDRR